MTRELPDEVQKWIGWQLFEQVPANIIVIDRDFRVVAANSSFEAVFGETGAVHCYEAYKRRTSVCDKCLAAQTFADGRPRITDDVGIDRWGRPAHFVMHIAPVFDVIGEVAYVIEMSVDVTEERSIRSNYDLLFERVPCYVALLDRDLKVVRMNGLARRTFGEPAGRRCFEVYKNRTDRCPGCPALRSFDDGGSYTARQHGQDEDGNPHCFLVSTAPLGAENGGNDYVIEMALDVTETEELTAKLVQEGAFRSNLTEHALDALVAVDEHGRIKVFNPAAERLFGVAAEEVLGTPEAERFFPPPIHELIAHRGEGLMVQETQIESRGGEEIPVRCAGSVLYREELFAGAAAFFHDLRALKRIEQEKLEAERFAAIGETVAQLAHGIKNTLTGLQGGMYMLKSGTRSGSAERTQKGWRNLERNLDRITLLVRGFLDFAKGAEVEAQLVDPLEIAEQVHALFEAAARKEGIRLRLESDPEVAPACLDPEQIHVCLENLVSNAIDACQVADAEEPEVTLRVGEEGGVLLFEVADTGCGMDYEIKRKVFTTFFTTKGVGGTGLGLLVTRKIVQQHGGRIQVESEPGRGSAFRIELPRDRLPPPIGEVAAPPAPQPKLEMA